MCIKQTILISPCRSGEDCRPFTVARFQEEEEQGPAVGRGEEELKGEGQDARGLDTSDYHSASSSDCGSTASSDTEEEAKEPAEAQEARQTEGEEKGDQEEAVQEEPYVIVMVPRSRDRLKQQSRDVPKKTKFARNLVSFFVLSCCCALLRYNLGLKINSTKLIAVTYCQTSVFTRCLLLPCSTFTNLLLRGRGSRRAPPCSSLQCAPPCLRHHRCLDTISCPSHLHPLSFHRPRSSL